MLPQENFVKLGTLRLLLRSFLGQNATRITQPVVSVAREMVQTSYQKKPPRTTCMLAPPQFAR